MPTYRERREARADRLREWADKREAKAESEFDRAKARADMIPFGQPVLVDHYSAGRDIRFRDSINRGFSRSFENERKAKSMRSRADNIESAAAHAIYSDDEDAIERLRDKIERLEAERARIKAYNASCRKGAPDASVLDEKQRAQLASITAHCPYQLGKGGAFPAYATSNLGGTINTARKRLAALESKGSE